MFLVGRFYRRVLATGIDAELGLITCVWDRIGQGFNLIPFSGVGGTVGGVSEAVGDEKIEGNGVEGSIQAKDMTNYEMTFEAHKQIVKPLSQTCTHIWRAQACAARKSARVCVW